MVRAGSCEVRVYSCAPTCSILVIDSEILQHTPYLPYLHSSQAPTWEVSGSRGTLLETYMEVFEEVWNRSQPALTAEFGPSRRIKARIKSPSDGPSAD